MPVDLIQNVFAQGDAADKLMASNFDVGVLRPWLGPDGRSYTKRRVRNAQGRWEARSVVTNAPATLTKDQWIQFDAAVIRAVQDRLRAFADLRAAGLTYNLPNGMAHTVLQYQTMGDVTGATVSMDPVRRSEGDRPQFDLANLPLPVVHKDFDFSAREIAVSRNGIIPMPLDTTMAELAGRKVAEEVENMTVGNVGAPFSYGGGSVYGYVNFPSRVTSTTFPTPDGTNGGAIISALLGLRQTLINNKHYGPYMVYCNGQWAQWLDTDFSTAKGDQTLRQRILSVEGIQDVRVLDHLPNTKYVILLVEMAPETVRAVVGMDVTTVQWESQGGMLKHFKVMCILVPQLRADTNGNSGIAHAQNAP